MNVTVYGDSILKGVVFENGRYVVERGWQQRLAERFGLSIRNRSRFGCTIEKALSSIRRDSETPAENEYALLEFGGNDCDFDWAAVAADPTGSHVPKTPPERFLSDYREAIALIRRGGRIPVALTLPPIHSELYFNFICRGGISGERILRWMGSADRIADWQRQYSELAAAAAREEGAALIDLRRAFPKDAAALREFLCVDGIHPSRRGQALLESVFSACCAK